jgi:hypothetical protein
VKQVSQTALDRTPDERPAFLEGACGDDRSLALVARLKLPN